MLHPACCCCCYGLACTPWVAGADPPQRLRLGGTVRVQRLNWWQHAAYSSRQRRPPLTRCIASCSAMNAVALPGCFLSSAKTVVQGKRMRMDAGWKCPPPQRLAVPAAGQRHAGEQVDGPGDALWEPPPLLGLLARPPGYKKLLLRIWWCSFRQLQGVPGASGVGGEAWAAQLGPVENQQKQRRGIRELLFLGLLTVTSLSPSAQLSSWAGTPPQSGHPAQCPPEGLEAQQQHADVVLAAQRVQLLQCHVDLQARGWERVDHDRAGR